MAPTGIPTGSGGFIDPRDDGGDGGSTSGGNGGGGGGGGAADPGDVDTQEILDRVREERRRELAEAVEQASGGGRAGDVDTERVAEQARQQRRRELADRVRRATGRSPGDVDTQRLAEQVERQQLAERIRGGGGRAGRLTSREVQQLQNRAAEQFIRQRVPGDVLDELERRFAGALPVAGVQPGADFRVQRRGAGADMVWQATPTDFLRARLANQQRQLARDLATAGGAASTVGIGETGVVEGPPGHMIGWQPPGGVRDWMPSTIAVDERGGQMLSGPPPTGLERRAMEWNRVVEAFGGRVGEELSTLPGPVRLPGVVPEAPAGVAAAQATGGTGTARTIGQGVSGVGQFLNPFALALGGQALVEERREFNRQRAAAFDELTGLTLEDLREQPFRSNPVTLGFEAAFAPQYQVDLATDVGGAAAAAPPAAIGAVRSDPFGAAGFGAGALGAAFLGPAAVARGAGGAARGGRLARSGLGRARRAVTGRPPPGQSIRHPETGQFVTAPRPVPVTERVQGTLGGVRGRLPSPSRADVRAALFGPDRGQAQLLPPRLRLRGEDIAPPRGEPRQVPAPLREAAERARRAGPTTEDIARPGDAPVNPLRQRARDLPVAPPAGTVAQTGVRDPLAAAIAAGEIGRLRAAQAPFTAGGGVGTRRFLAPGGVATDALGRPVGTGQWAASLPAVDASGIPVSGPLGQAGGMVPPFTRQVTEPSVMDALDANAGRGIRTGVNQPVAPGQMQPVGVGQFAPAGQALGVGAVPATAPFQTMAQAQRAVSFQVPGMATPIAPGIAGPPGGTRGGGGVPIPGLPFPPGGGRGRRDERREFETIPFVNPFASAWQVLGIQPPGPQNGAGNPNPAPSGNPNPNGNGGGFDLNPY